MTVFWLKWSNQLLAGLLLGGVIFTSFLTAPLVFLVLDREASTKFTRKLWPRYFMICAVLGLILLSSLLVVSGLTPATGIVAGFVVLMLANLVVARRIRRIRGDEIDSGMGDQSDRLHRLSVGMNYVCLLLIVLTHYLVFAG